MCNYAFQLKKRDLHVRERDSSLEAFLRFSRSFALCSFDRLPLKLKRQRNEVHIKMDRFKRTGIHSGVCCTTVCIRKVPRSFFPCNYFFLDFIFFPCNYFSLDFIFVTWSVSSLPNTSFALLMSGQAYLMCNTCPSLNASSMFKICRQTNERSTPRGNSLETHCSLPKACRAVAGP